MIILRQDLDRALTHNELDYNFTSLDIKQWALGDYDLGQKVYITEGGITTVYDCVKNHIQEIYAPSNTFITSYSGTTLWFPIANTISTGITFNDIYTTGLTYNTNLSGNTLTIHQTQGTSPITVLMPAYSLYNHYTYNALLDDRTLQLERTGGLPVLEVDLQPIIDVATGVTYTDKYVTGGTLNGSNHLLLDRNDAIQIDVDLSALMDGNYYVTGGTLIGTILNLHKNFGGNSEDIQLSGLTANLPTFDTYVSGGTYNNTTKLLTLNRSDDVAVNIDVSALATTGATGDSGYSGYSGIGTSGYSGYSGYSGQDGTDGTSGYSGYSGISGYMGTSGYSGYSGVSTSGYSGKSGTSGYSGYSGVSGFSGDNQGTSGYSGISGYSGDNKGTSGYSGISGWSGLSGYSGYSGIGVSGYSGAGTSGYSGYSGYSGISGADGSSSSSGYSGYSGSAGTSGYSGYSGISGYSGYSGESGYSGYSGIGTSGYSGYSGMGISGISGYSGYSGTSTSGYSGYSGTTIAIATEGNNRILTSDGAGGINAEQYFTFDESEYETTLQAFGTGHTDYPVTKFMRGFGTFNTPEEITDTNSILGEHNYLGIGKAETGHTGLTIRIRASEAWSETYGTSWELWSILNGETSLTNRVKISGDGLIGLGGVTTPTSTVHVGGSFAWDVEHHVSANYTASTETLILLDISSNITITLPQASTCKGRVYAIYAHSLTGGETPYTGTIARSGFDTIGWVYTSLTLDTIGDGAFLVSDGGTNWVVINSRGV